MQDLTEIVRFLSDKEMKLTTAESCTCGLMASLLGDIPGCGQVLDSGFVVYSPKAKNRLLHVSFETVETFGLTSEEVAGKFHECAEGLMPTEQRARVLDLCNRLDQLANVRDLGQALRIARAGD